MAKAQDKSKMSKAWRMATLKRSIPIYLMALPGLIYLFINNYMPMPGIILAFKNYKAKFGIYGSPWAGFKISSTCSPLRMPSLSPGTPSFIMWYSSL